MAKRFICAEESSWSGFKCQPKEGFAPLSPTPLSCFARQHDETSWFRRRPNPPWVGDCENPGGGVLLSENPDSLKSADFGEMLGAPALDKEGVFFFPIAASGQGRCLQPFRPASRGFRQNRCERQKLGHFAHFSGKMFPGARLRGCVLS